MIVKWVRANPGSVRNNELPISSLPVKSQKKCQFKSNLNYFDKRSYQVWFKQVTYYEIL